MKRFFSRLARRLCVPLAALVVALVASGSVAAVGEVSVTGFTLRLPDGDTIILDEQGRGHRLRAHPVLLAQLGQLAQYRITVIGTPQADPLEVANYPIGVRDFRIEPGGVFDGQEVTVTGPTRRLPDGDVIVVDEFERGHRLTQQPFPDELVGRVVTVSGSATISNAAARLTWPILVRTVQPVTLLRFVATGPAVSGLSPLNENPSHPESTASGTAVVTWDTAASTMTVDVAFSGLTTPNTAAHIHCCVAAPGNAGVATTVPTFTGFPSGTTSGTYSHTFDMLDVSSYNAAFVAAQGGTAASAAAALLAGLEAGQAYLNIHTTTFPAGEIRGFLPPA